MDDSEKDDLSAESAAQLSRDFRRRQLLSWINFSLWGISLAIGIFVVTRDLASIIPTLPLNEKLTRAAWKAFNADDYPRAINSAEKCISQFRAAADSKQAEMESNGTPLPDLADVTTSQRSIILSRAP